MDKNTLTEKYRPKDFDLMEMDDINKKILNNIITTNNFPNLLFYGQPGTGKTTTIINLIDKYLQKNNIKNKGLVMHFNASDDRGIELIRKQILDFIKSDGLLSNSVKFIILDEVDYMTKQAQMQLKLEIEKYYDKVRFCLICNYICKLEKSLLSEFIIMRFSNIGFEKTTNILKNIVDKEKLDKSKEDIDNILNYYKTDIRSMINYLQHSDKKIFSKKHYIEFKTQILNNSIEDINLFLLKKCSELNIPIEQFLKKILIYVIDNNNNLTYKVLIDIERIFIYSFEVSYLLSYMKENSSYLFLTKDLI